MAMRNRFHRCAALLALLALAEAGIAHAQGEACLSRDDLAGMFAYALPSVIEAAGGACRTSLPRDGFLATQGVALAQRYRAGKAAAWPVAKAAVLKIGGQQGGALGASLVAALPDSALQPFAEGMIGQYVTAAIHPGDCPEIEQALRFAAPLPPENTAGLVALIVARLDRARPGHRPGLPLCAPARKDPTP